MSTEHALLRAILSVTARQAFPPAELLKIVAPVGNGVKQIAAYNLCNGATPQADIAKKLKLDKGSLSRTIARWIDAGVVIRVGSEHLPLHVYPLSNDAVKSASAG